MKNQEIVDFVKELKATDHVIMFYSKPEDKREVLFTYLKAGLDQGEAAAYVATQESPDEIIDSSARLELTWTGLRDPEPCVFSPTRTSTSRAASSAYKRP